MTTRSVTEPEVEPYKLSEIFSIVPDFERDLVFLGTFLNTCQCAYEMFTGEQRHLLVIYIKNKLSGRAAQLISFKNQNLFLDL